MRKHLKLAQMFNGKFSDAFLLTAKDKVLFLSINYYRTIGKDIILTISGKFNRETRGS